MRFLVALLLAGAMLGAPESVPARRAALPAERDCGSLKSLLRRLNAEERLAYLADAVSAEGRVYMWYIDRRSGRWAQVIVYRDRHACVLMRGSRWHFSTDGLALPPSRAGSGPEP